MTPRKYIYNPVLLTLTVATFSPLYSAAQIFYELSEEYKVCWPSALLLNAVLISPPLQSRGVGIFITHLRPAVQKTFAKAGLYDLLGYDAFRINVADAMAIVEGERTRESSFILGSH